MIQYSYSPSQMYDKMFLNALKVLSNFRLFSLKNNLTSRQVNKKVKTKRRSATELTLSPRVWGSRVSTSPLVYSLKRPLKYCCRVCTILHMTFKKRLFIEGLCRPLFTKYAHFKILFVFQNNA